MKRFHVPWWALATALLVSACTSGQGGGREAVEQIASADDLTPAQTRCILQRVETEFGMMLDDLEGSLTPEQELTVAIARDVCLLDVDDSPPPTGSVTGDTLPHSLADAPSRFDPDSPPPGEDELLDALWIGCAEGRAASCDELFFNAEPGSEYEAFAFSCGGRENLRCESLLGSDQAVPEALSPDTPAPGLDAALDHWWGECAEGSARACDQLLLTSPGGSDYYAFGNTCGGRAVAYCGELLGDDGLPPVLASVRPDDPAPGEDEFLDQLWGACSGGNALGCEQLYAAAPYGSAYERFAISCGGRQVAPCERVFLADEADRIESEQDRIVRGE